MKVSKPKRKEKRKKPKRQSLRQRLLQKWYLAVKLRANYTSEISGVVCRRPGEKSARPIANAHHIFGKRNGYLAFALDNGICLTQGEHGMGVHSLDPPTALEMQNRIRLYIGEDRWRHLQSLRTRADKPNLKIVEAVLDNAIAQYTEG